MQRLTFYIAAMAVTLAGCSGHYGVSLDIENYCTLSAFFDPRRGLLIPTPDEI